MCLESIPILVPHNRTLLTFIDTRPSRLTDQTFKHLNAQTMLPNVILAHLLVSENWIEFETKLSLKWC